MLVLTLLSACGDDQHKAEGTSGSPNLTEAAEGRVLVATVNGRPVHDDCVRIQAEKTGVDERTALQQCIDFELLAQEAERKGYSGDPSVLATRKREAVRAFLEAEFVSEFDGPEDVPEAAVKRHWAKNRFDYNYPEYRFVAHALARLPKNTPPGSGQDLAARKIADALHAHLAGERWDADGFMAAATRFRADRLLTRLVAKLDPLTTEGANPDLVEILHAVAGAVTEPPIIIQNLPRGFPAGGGGRYAIRFADAAFAIREEGMVAPPARTMGFGWHVIMLAKIIPEQRDTYQDADPKIRKKLFQRERFAAFQRWQSTLTRGLAIEIDEESLARLVEAERARDPFSKLEKTR